QGLRIRVAGIAALVVVSLAALTYMAWSAVDPEALRRQGKEAAAAQRWDAAEAALARLPDPTPADWLLRAMVARTRKDDAAASRHLAHVPADGPLAAQAALVAAQIAQGRH